jgi:anti-sigma regulatory factor (Ser/Thr protein kinase)
MVSMEREPEISIRIFSDPHLLATVRGAIDGLAKCVGFQDKSRALITLAIDEAMTNVIRHGYGNQTSGMIWLHMWRSVEPRGLRIIIEDLGKATEPSKIKGRNLEDVRPGGLGVHIIKETMNEATWEARPSGGMRLTLAKWLNAEELAAAYPSPSTPEQSEP